MGGSSPAATLAKGQMLGALFASKGWGKAMPGKGFSTMFSPYADGKAMAGKGFSAVFSPYANGKAKAAGMKKANPEAKIYVGNLAFKTTWQGLKDHMSAAGTVVYAKINVDSSQIGFGFALANGREMSKGTGLVEYASPMEALNAIGSLNGSELDGRAITVDWWGQNGQS